MDEVHTPPDTHPALAYDGWKVRTHGLEPSAHDRLDLPRSPLEHLRPDQAFVCSVSAPLASLDSPTLMAEGTRQQEALHKPKHR
jgi:hypothetical protein